MSPPIPRQVDTALSELSKTSEVIFRGGVAELEGVIPHPDASAAKIPTSPYGVNETVHKDLIAATKKRLGKTKLSLSDWKNLAMKLYRGFVNKLSTEVPNWDKLSEGSKFIMGSIKFNTGRTYTALPKALGIYEINPSEKNLANVIKNTRRQSKGVGFLPGIDNRSVRELRIGGIIDLNNANHLRLLRKHLPLFRLKDVRK